MWQGSTHPLIFMDDVLDKQSTSMVNEGLCERGSTAKIIKCDRKLACSKTRCLHSGSPPAQGQSKPVRTTGRQTEVSSSIKSPLESLGLRHLLLKKGVFCQLRRQQISDNFNGVKAFIYTQTWSIKSVRQRGGLFFPPTQARKTTQAKVRTMCQGLSSWSRKKHFHTNLEKYSLCCQYVAVRKTLSQTKLKGKPQSKNAVDRLIKNSLAKPPQLKHVKTSLVQWNETKHLERWNTKDCYTMVLVTIHSSSTAPAKTCPTPGQRELTKTVWQFGKTAPDETGLGYPLPFQQSLQHQQYAA